MIFSKPLTACIVLGCLVNYVFGAAYEININGQTYQVNVVGQSGESYGDRSVFSDDYGELLDDQKDAICSSLRGEYCEQVTNNGAKTHNLFNYFPNHASESVVAHANNRYNKDESPYLLKQPLDDRTLQYLSRQNPHSLGTKPIKPKMTQNTAINNINDMAQTLLDPLKLVGSQKLKYKKRKNKKPKNNENNNNQISTENDNDNDNNNDNGEDEEYSDVEVELYSNLAGDTELANALGLDDDEFGETVDRIVAQLVASYIDNDSDEVDVGQIFANEMSVENGDVSMEEITLDEGAREEMNELLTNIAKKHKKKQNNAITDGETEEIDQENQNDGDAQIFALKFVVPSDNDNNNDNDDNDENEQEEDDLF